MEEFRIEKDSLGEVKVPKWAYWGAQTQRAVENFPISGLKMPKIIIWAIALIKRYAAEVNMELGLLKKELGEAIIKAAEEIMNGVWDEHFPVDVFQTGSGTSTNMNVNEVIANRANELLGYELGKYYPVHPNDHVNMGQSSNDVIPSAIHIAVRIELEKLLDALKSLYNTFVEKANEFMEVIKLGRTHLQDAVPITLGQEFSAYASMIKKDIERIENNFKYLEELPLGGTAVGTGLNAHPQFGRKVIEKISSRLKIPFREAENRFEQISSKSALVSVMGALNVLASDLMKIANDLRLMASGPRGGFGEIEIPPLQPGSSIMPGKVNPVILESMIQVAAQVMGAHLTVTLCNQFGPLDLNVMMPTIAYNILFSIEILKNAIKVFDEKCLRGIKANVERCRNLAEKSIALATVLAKKIGYDKASRIAMKALKEGKTVIEVAIEEGVISEDEAKELFNFRKLVGLDK